MADIFYLLALFTFQLFIIVNPFATIPVYLSLTKSNTPKQRVRIALIASAVSIGVLIFFGIFGNLLVNSLGIGINAIKIGGGLLLLITGMNMVYGKFSSGKITDKEHTIASKMEDISVTPLAIPLLAGPGAITTVLIFSNTNTSIMSSGALVLGVILVGLSAYLLLRYAGRVNKFIGEIGMNALGKVFGMIWVFLSTEIIIQGLTAVLAAAV
jgi:multiple antibiotic resistance protein